MIELVEWLRSIELLAYETYEKAAERFQDNMPFRHFMQKLAEDEAGHYHFMGSAHSFLKTHSHIDAVLSVGSELDMDTRSLFEKIQIEIDNPTTTEQSLILKILEAELSELNPIFYYAMSELRKINPSFKYALAKMEAHKGEIQRFVESIEGGSDLLKRMKTVPSLWTENILLVDDNETILELVESLLFNAGNIDKAINGKMALEKVEKKFYKLIISDIDMPEMNGFSFYQKSIERFPELKHRFIFLSGDLTKERRKFLNDQQVLYMEKPMKIAALRDAAQKILLRR